MSVDSVAPDQTDNADIQTYCKWKLRAIFCDIPFWYSGDNSYYSSSLVWTFPSVRSGATVLVWTRSVIKNLGFATIIMVTNNDRGKEVAKYDSDV